MKLINSYCIFIQSDFKSKRIRSLVTVILYIMIFLLSNYFRSSFINRNTFDNILISDYIGLLVIIKMVISGISIPYDILEKEINKYKFYKKYTLIDYPGELLLVSRINFKLLKSVLLNYITILFIVRGTNIIFDVKNYINLLLPLVAGSFFISILGYIMSMVGIIYDIKRETLSIIQIIFTVLFLNIKKEYYLIPFSIAKNLIKAIIKSDLVFSEYYMLNNAFYIPYLLFTVIISIFSSSIILTFFGYLYRNKKLKEVNNNFDIIEI